MTEKINVNLPEFDPLAPTGRNDPCWCGSGKKFKKCHLGREDERRLELGEAIGTFNRAFRRPTTCQYAGGCGSQSIQSHSIQKGTSLQTIALNGHVMQLRPEKGMNATKVGVNDASTFGGFCARHDTEVFRPLETTPFAATTEQVFLSSYRALCSEIFRKRAVLRLMGQMRGLDAGQDPAGQQFVQELAASTEWGNQMGLAELDREKTRADTMLKARDFSRVRAVVFELGPSFPIVTSGCFAPEFDAAGSRLQSLDDAHLQNCSLTTEAASGSRYAILEWHADDSIAERFALSLRAAPQDRLGEVVARCAFARLENTYFAKRWWDGLGPKTTELIRELSLSHLEAGNELRPGGGFVDCEATLSAIGPH